MNSKLRWVHSISNVDCDHVYLRQIYSIGEARENDKLVPSEKILQPSCNFIKNVGENSL
jgi:hypothetical protein